MGRTAPAEAMTEDFLYHLYRGSELLTDGRFDGAREELDRAMRLQPRDPAAQDLLAKLYFRLGIHPRAIELYLDVVKQVPDQIPPRINLALAFLKTGQMREAVTHLLPVIERDPTHRRAWGYLGLAWSRLGEYAKAREAFARAGHDAMARRMDEELTAQYDLGANRPSLAPPSAMVDSRPDAPSQPPGATLDAHARAAIVHSVASGEFDELEPGGLDPASLSVDPSSESVSPGTWTTREPGDSLRDWEDPLGGRAVALAQLERATAVAPRGDAIEIRHGSLIVTAACAARVGADGVGAGLRVGPAMVRKVRGEGTAFAGAPPLVAVTEGWCVLPPRRGMTRRVLSLSGDGVTLAETALVAFERRLEYTNRVLESDEQRLPLVAIRGEGLIAIESRGPLRSIAVNRESSVTLRPERLLGWSGQIECLPASSPRGNCIECRGIGFVVVSLDELTDHA